jgi:hypothetical protein
MQDAARIVDARASIQSGKFRAGMFDAGDTDSSTGPEEQ